MNLELYDKNGKRITYVVLKPNFTIGEDIQIGGCTFKYIEGKYVTQDDPLSILQPPKGK